MKTSIKEFIKKIKCSLEILENKDIFTILIIILVAFSSFGLGRLSKIEETRPQVQIENTASVIDANISAGVYVASKNGGSYHLPWCSGAKRIKEENKIWFGSKQEAEKLGYKPAGNCKGL